MLYRKVDENGLFVEDVTLSEPPVLTDDDHQYISEPVPQGFYLPKWNGREWVECATQEEIDELTKPQPHEPTIEERLEQTEELLQTVTMAFTEYVFMQDTSDDS